MKKRLFFQQSSFGRQICIQSLFRPYQRSFRSIGRMKAKHLVRCRGFIMASGSFAALITLNCTQYFHRGCLMLLAPINSHFCSPLRPDQLWDPISYHLVVVIYYRLLFACRQMQQHVCVFGPFCIHFQQQLVACTRQLLTYHRCCKLYILQEEICPKRTSAYPVYTFVKKPNLNWGC